MGKPVKGTIGSRVVEVETVRLTDFPGQRFELS
jgi:hypothetical protein